MENEKSTVIDWVFPPASVEAMSLWDGLHDARLEAVRVDHAENALQLEFDCWHIRKFHGFPEGMRFRLQFSELESIRVIAKEPPFETSASITEFTQSVDAENGSTDTFEADLLRGPESIALRLFLHVNDDFYPELTIRANRLSISMSSGEALSLDDFLRLGEAYWNDFAETSRKKQD